MRAYIKRFWVLALLVAASGLVHATEPEVLWWFIGGDENVDWYGTNISVDQLTTMKGQYYSDEYGEGYSLSAKMSVRNDSGDTLAYLNLYSAYQDPLTGAYVTYPTGGQTTQSLAVPPVNAFADLGAYAAAGYSFAIELGNEVDGQWTSVVVSEVRSYTSLGDHITDWAPGITAVPDVPWIPSYHIPEPCSGLLLLVGGGLLALRRRRRA